MVERNEMEDLHAQGGTEQKTVAILGLGYVGLPLALLFVDRGFRVLGIDPDADKVEKLHKGISYIHEISNRQIQEAMMTDRFLPTNRHSAIQAAEAIIICVPTPLTAYGTPDLSFLTIAASQVGHRLKKGQLVVLESSTYPGTTREVLLPLLEKTGLKAGEHFHLAYSPERVDPGNERFPLERIPKIVSGITEGCLDRILQLYGQVFPSLHPVSSTDAAEMAKILENSYRLINISFINEMAMLSDQLNLDVWEVIDAAGTKPFGFMPFYPGPGIGGHCIPVDPSYLLWKAKQHGMTSEFISMSNAVNHKMPLYIVQQLRKAMAPKPLSGSNILIYGAAYKPNIADARESASIDLMKLMQLEGANVFYHDPYIPQVKLGDGPLTSVELTPKLVESMDAVIIATPHKGMPLTMLAEHAAFIYDTRNVTRHIEGRGRIMRLGTGTRSNSSQESGGRT
ncbi:nucleotide sugar dehydrogenase [Paenibacillus soyae]|uniref:Nucleotide sugar dehydrogenase n=1 Tax=Paenibacillus soyae TaxID=2969249 RepID=A0A9X2MQJ4_9BACL|nr:nucleotide sugar dehydrogenase [Paenibacillus soyae]MCR2804344.1 nucleotide sugar dehydrogenase [Paenibacillus soyae]